MIHNKKKNEVAVEFLVSDETSFKPVLGWGLNLFVLPLKITQRCA